MFTALPFFYFFHKECLFFNKKIYSSSSARKDTSFSFELFRYMSDLRLHACRWTRNALGPVGHVGMRR